VKLELNNLLERPKPRELNILTTEVKGTIAQEFKKDKKRIFSNVDLWDIQRRRKKLLVKRIMF
jgi:hypothetical protein